MDNGWILLHRRFFDHHFWREKRELSKAEAWVDLIQSARFKKGENSILHNGQIVKWKRGQLVASIRFLRERWGWKSNTKVSSFLVLLEKEDMIVYEKKTVIGRITICKYEDYQTTKDAYKDSDKTQIRQAEDETGKKGKEGKECMYSFSDFWDLYDKKKERKKCEPKWNSISEKDKKKIMEFIPIYKESNSEKYLKYPYSFLNSEIWNDDWDSYKKTNQKIKAEYYI